KWRDLFTDIGDSRHEDAAQQLQRRWPGIGRCGCFFLFAPIEHLAHLALAVSVGADHHVAWCEGNFQAGGAIAQLADGEACVGDRAVDLTLAERGEYHIGVSFLDGAAACAGLYKLAKMVHAKGKRTAPL